MISISPSMPSGTFNPDDLNALLEQLPVHIGALGSQLVQFDVTAEFLGGTIAPPPIVPVKARAAIAAKVTSSAVVTSLGGALRHDSMAAVAFLKSHDASGYHNVWAQHPETRAN